MSTQAKSADGDPGGPGGPAGLACPECGNRDDFTGWIRVFQRIDLSGDGTYAEAFGDDDLDERGGDLSAREGEAAVAGDVACSECGHDIGDVRFSHGETGGETGGERNG